MRRSALLLALLWPLAGATRRRRRWRPKASWAQRADHASSRRDGLMGGDAASFKPDAPLTQDGARRPRRRLDRTGRSGDVREPETPVTMAQLDARLVASLGLPRPMGSQGHEAAGLAPSAVRHRGGRPAARPALNHPAGRTRSSCAPQPATRAEAAYSPAQILRFGALSRAVRRAAATFPLPGATPWQRRILATAFYRRLPYIWGGTSDGAGDAVRRPSRRLRLLRLRLARLRAAGGRGRRALDALRGRTTYG